MLSSHTAQTSKMRKILPWHLFMVGIIQMRVQCGPKQTIFSYMVKPQHISIFKFNISQIIQRQSQFPVIQLLLVFIQNWWEFMKRNMEIISIPPTIPDLEMGGQFGNISTKIFFSIMMVRGLIGFKLNWNHYLDNGFWKIFPDYRDNNYAIISEARGLIPIPEQGWKFYYKDSNVYDETLTVNGTRFLKYFFFLFRFWFFRGSSCVQHLFGSKKQKFIWYTHRTIQTTKLHSQFQTCLGGYILYIKNFLSW